MYLSLLRKGSQRSTDSLRENTQTAKSILSRIKQGQTERLEVSEVASLDEGLQADEKIFSMFWLAMEFKEGICRNRFFSNTPGAKLYRWSAFSLADTFVTLSRWTESYTSLDWLKEFRKDDVYSQVVNAQPTDYRYGGYNMEELSAEILEQFKPGLPYLLSASRRAEQADLINLWQSVENELAGHPLGAQVLRTLHFHIPDESYYGMLKAALQESMRANPAFRLSLAKSLTSRKESLKGRKPL